MTTHVACAASADERPNNVEAKTRKPCRHIVHAGINRGWMPENYPSLPPGVKYFLLTSPSIEPGAYTLAAAGAGIGFDFGGTTQRLIISTTNKPAFDQANQSPCCA